MGSCVAWFSCRGRGGADDLLQADTSVGNLHQAIYIMAERLSTSVGEFLVVSLASMSPSGSGESVGLDSYVGSALELYVCPRRLDECFPAVQEGCQLNLLKTSFWTSYHCVLSDFRSWKTQTLPNITFPFKGPPHKIRPQCYLLEEEARETWVEYLIIIWYFIVLVAIYPLLRQTQLIWSDLAVYPRHIWAQLVSFLMSHSHWVQHSLVPIVLDGVEQSWATDLKLDGRC